MLASPEGRTQEGWTGFSVSVGAGAEILSAGVNSQASRTDDLGICLDETCEGAGILSVASLEQSVSSRYDDLSDSGFFGSVGLAYDRQFGARWVAGAFVDGDLPTSVEAKADQTDTTNFGLSVPDGSDDSPNFNETIGGSTVKTQVELDSMISVGGRLGWLATPNTLLYALASYTHAELSDPRIDVQFADPGPFFGEIFSGVALNAPTAFSVRLPDSLDGFSLGGGVENKIAGPWSLKFEYRWTHLEGTKGSSRDNEFECCSTPADSGDLNVGRRITTSGTASLDADIQAVKAAVVYRFASGS